MFLDPDGWHIVGDDYRIDPNSWLERTGTSVVDHPATMEDVQSDYDHGEVTGVIRNAKRSIKHGFNRAQEEARGMFEKVKRSFSDFINRE